MHCTTHSVVTATRSAAAAAADPLLLAPANSLHTTQLLLHYDGIAIFRHSTAAACRLISVS